MHIDIQMRLGFITFTIKAKHNIVHCYEPNDWNKETMSLSVVILFVCCIKYDAYSHLDWIDLNC